MKKLKIDFYQRTDVLLIARELLGKIVITNINGTITSGRIVETEAYAGVADKASHAFNGKRTARNEHMYAQAGTAYVYICYGIHQMFNIVTNEQEIPHAILVRAVAPLEGVPAMLERTGKSMPGYTLTKGPGNVGKALGITKSLSGANLTGDTVYIADDGQVITTGELGISPRIGVLYAGEDAMLPYRFYIRGNPYVSGKPNK